MQNTTLTKCLFLLRLFPRRLSSRRLFRNIPAIFVSVALLMGSGSVFAKDKAKEQPFESTPYGDWTLLCPKGKGAKEKKSCSFIQQATIEVGEAKSKLPIVSFEFIQAGKPRSLHAVLGISLFLEGGIVLAPGVRLQIDDKKESFNLPFGHCKPNNCIAGGKISAELRKKFQAGNKVKVSFLTPSGKTINVSEISLRGITAGLKALDKKK
uniref:Invasion protein IalB, involved in pathogenesis n=1 Tax=Candidatus Kentrum sp. TUN TaxID=2126343 RepID=A0A450ZLR7_9GAMM|nr:MAG: Invasion protein IalB, involved in pathogenesis [Candidatus Kentron sp. TUN]VFK58958.1 MAG: Invasion protein IalB, involved in pathogenesis [Candidatus Kentron sp. TUN]